MPSSARHGLNASCESTEGRGPALPAAYRLADPGAKGAVADGPPRCVFFEVTNRCNLSCAACVRTHRQWEEPRDLSFDEFVALSDQFPALERAVLHGIGEPLLQPDLTRMIRYLKDRQVAVLFNSNATLLTPELCEALVLSGLDEFRVSLDAADEQTYLRTRGLPLLKRVVQNLRQFVASIQRLGRFTPRLSLWCIADAENLEQLPELVRLAASIGIPEVYVQRLVYFTDSDGDRDLRLAAQSVYRRLQEREVEVLARCSRLSDELGVAFTASGACRPDQSLGGEVAGLSRPWSLCRRPWTTAYVTARGNALPCCISPFATGDYPQLLLGNLWQQPFSEIWNSPRYQAWRTALLSDDPPAPCRGCGVYWSL